MLALTMFPVSRQHSRCGDGGIIIFEDGITYSIRSLAEFSACSGCEIQVEGILKLSDDTDFWEGRRSVFHLDGVSGATIHSTSGSGVVDGNGVPFWKAFADNSDYARPTLMYIEGGSSGITISNLRFQDAPNVFHTVSGDSTNILYSGLTLYAVEADGAEPKNTDGFNVGAFAFVTIEHTDVTNDDDCIAFKPGSTFTYVHNITL